MSHPLVELSGVSRTVPAGNAVLHILRDVSFAVSPGERVALLGNSGSGKSTALHLIAGLDTPTSGSVRVAGRDWATLSPRDRAAHRLATVGTVFQAFHLLPNSTALENVELPLMLAGVPRRLRREQAAASLAAVGLGERLSHLPAQLSGGEQQRVAIARAVVHRPALVLADEPTGNLDSATADRVVDLLTGVLNELGAGLVLVTHDAELPGRLTTRTLRLRDGGLVGA